MSKTDVLALLLGFVIGIASGFCIGYAKGKEDGVKIQIPKVQFEWPKKEK